MDLRYSNGKKILLQEMLVPEQRGRGGPRLLPHFLWDNVKYVLGIGDGKDLPSFNNFKKLHNKYLESNNPLLKFINDFEPSKAFENQIILKYRDEFKSNSNIVFRIEGEDCYLHEKEELLKAWREDNSKETNEISIQCLITGKIEPIARVHTSIKGVRNAHTAGAGVVTFNDESSEFYGKKLGYNAPTSKSAMFKYTTVLNYLLRNDKTICLLERIQLYFGLRRKAYMKIYY